MGIALKQTWFESIQLKPPIKRGFGFRLKASIGRIPGANHGTVRLLTILDIPSH